MQNLLNKLILDQDDDEQSDQLYELHIMLTKLGLKTGKTIQKEILRINN